MRIKRSLESFADEHQRYTVRSDGLGCWSVFERDAEAGCLGSPMIKDIADRVVAEDLAHALDGAYWRGAGVAVEQLEILRERATSAFIVSEDSDD